MSQQLPKKVLERIEREAEKIYKNAYEGEIREIDYTEGAKDEAERAMKLVEALRFAVTTYDNMESIPQMELYCKFIEALKDWEEN